MIKSLAEISKEVSGFAGILKKRYLPNDVNEWTREELLEEYIKARKSIEYFQNEKIRLDKAVKWYRPRYRFLKSRWDAGGIPK